MYLFVATIFVASKKASSKQASKQASKQSKQAS
jgi:hypothetical protein